MRLPLARRLKVHIAVAVGLLLIVGSLGSSAAQTGPQPPYQDGGYVSVSDGGPHGYVLAIVIVRDGQVATVRLTEMDGQGNAKPASYPWDQFHEAMDELPLRFIAANGPDIDGLTGATGTSDKAIQAVARALLKSSDPGPGTYFDGTFFGRSPADDNGFGTALVTIQNDAVVSVVLGEINADGSVKDFDTYPHEITVAGKDTMEQRFAAAGHPDVDLIVGATGSSIKWIAAVENAMKMAMK